MLWFHEATWRLTKGLSRIPKLDLVAGLHYAFSDTRV